MTMPTSITTDFQNNKIIVTFEDDTTKEYTQTEKEQYITDFPDRNLDIVAMGW